MEAHEKLAYDIQERLGITDPVDRESSFGFYCKVAMALPENKIWFLVERAKKGKKPGALFNHMARKEMS